MTAEEVEDSPCIVISIPLISNWYSQVSSGSTRVSSSRTPIVTGVAFFFSMRKRESLAKTSRCLPMQIVHGLGLCLNFGDSAFDHGNRPLLLYQGYG